MTTADAGNAWAKTGAIISPVKAVGADSYPNDLAKREAAQVAGASVVYSTAPTSCRPAPRTWGRCSRTRSPGPTVDLGRLQPRCKTAWTDEK